MKILVFGSLNNDYVYDVDHFVIAGETLSSSGLNIYPGGKGLNQSISLAKRSRDVYMAACVGLSDSDNLLKELSKNNVDTKYINTINSPSGHAIIQKTIKGENGILLFGGANQKISTEMVDSVLKDFYKGDYLILQNEINNMEYIINRAYDLGMIIVFNPSPYDELIKSYPIDKVTYMLLNEIETRELIIDSGIIIETEDIEVISNKLMSAYPKINFLITKGKAGAYFINKDETIFQESFEVEALDTTAAGDTFTGYFISSVIKGLSYKESMRIATAAAALCVSKHGASISIPEVEEVFEFLETRNGSID